MNNDKNSCADRFVHHNTSRAFTTAKTSGKSGVRNAEVDDPGDVWCQNANVTSVRYDERNKVELTRHHYQLSSSTPKRVNMFF